jgi:hypothetical protein
MHRGSPADSQPQDVFEVDKDPSEREATITNYLA